MVYYNGNIYTMRTPIRKAGKYTGYKPDPFLTLGKLNEIKNKLRQLKQNLPLAIAEVKRLGEMGDFSENAAYAMAKGRLRGMNQRILELEDQLKQAQVIEPSKNSGKVQLGSRVTVEIEGEQKTYLILGSAETNPKENVISHRSPIGAALVGYQAGDRVTYLSAAKLVDCKILKIE